MNYFFRLFSNSPLAPQINAYLKICYFYADKLKTEDPNRLFIHLNSVNICPWQKNVIILVAFNSSDLSLAANINANGTNIEH